LKDEGALQYYPCLGSRIQNSTIAVDSSTGYIELPATGIHVLIPVIETICHPTLTKYAVIISHTGGAQHVTHSFKDGGLIPAYTSTSNDFNGSFELFSQLSDAVALYADFASNLNRSNRSPLSAGFFFPNSSELPRPYHLGNGVLVESCGLNYSQGFMSYSLDLPPEIWPLSVFERRLGPRHILSPAFDTGMARELLVNTTISALSMNERFDVVNGTETRNFNVYHFQNKLAFFLPYGLSLGLAIPIIVLGLIALYVQNHGVSAISGGFLQLLMTTSGRTAIERTLIESSATLGGHENVSKELLDMEIRYGELIHGDNHGFEQSEVTGTHADGSHGIAEGEEEMEGWAESVVRPDNVRPRQRAGFGTAHDIKPLQESESKLEA